MLETARQEAGTILRNDVLLRFTDGEEPAPRFGSSAFVSDHAWARELGFVINLEAIGGGGPSMLVETSGPDEWIVNQYTDALQDPVAYSYLTTTAELIGGSNSDFESFRDLRIPGVEVAHILGSPIYHTLGDTPDRVSRRSLHHHGANALALTRHFGEPRPSRTARSRRRRVLHGRPFRSASVPRVLGGPALPAGRSGARHRDVAESKTTAQHLRAILAGIASLLIAVLLSDGAAVAVWTVLATWRASPGIKESYLYLAGLVAMTVGICALVSWLVRRRTSSSGDVAGVIGVWW